MDEPIVPWRPLSRRNDPSLEEVLHEGVPDHLLLSLQGWVRDVVDPLGLAGLGTGYDDELRSVERCLGIGPFVTVSDLAELLLANPEMGLDVVDLLCRTLGERGERPGLPRRELIGGPHVSRLATILSQGRSVWTVQEWNGHLSLVRIVETTVSERARHEAAGGRPAAEHLAAAWTHLYGRHPDPNQALDEANRALEAAAKPIVIPDDTKATLGKIVNALRAKPSKWKVALGTVEQLADRLDAIWRAQIRHGNDDPDVRRAIDPATAEAAVHDTVTLVHWFRAGLVERGPMTPPLGECA